MKDKRPMQNVSFDTIEELLDFIPEEELRVTEYLRRLVKDCIPDAEEYLSFNIPCYRRKRVICFIWPGSVSWGSVTNAGVRFGFQYGHLLTDDTGYLDRGKRKQVYWRDFMRVEEIDVDILRALLYEAVLVDSAKRSK